MSLPAVEELKTHLERQLPGVSLSVEGEAVIVSPKDLTAVCRYLKDTPQFGMDYLSNLTAVDYPPDLPAEPPGGAPSGAVQAGRIDLVVQLYSIQHRHGPVTLTVHVDRANPRVDSLTPIWRGAEYQEREVYDLFGIVFQGHPDLRRILMWDEFEGHPMRKDYVVEDQDEPIEKAV